MSTAECNMYGFFKFKINQSTNVFAGEDKDDVLTRLKGLMVCRYCSQPSTTSLADMKAHLASQHPHLDPVAIDVKNKLQKKSSSLYICPMEGCEYNSTLLKLFISHLKEHPDTTKVTLSQTAMHVKKIAKGKKSSDMEALESLPSHMINMDTSMGVEGKQGAKGQVEKGVLGKKGVKRKAGMSLTSRNARKRLHVPTSPETDSPPKAPNMVSLPNIDDVYNITGAMRSKARSTKLHIKDRFMCKHCDRSFTNLTKGKAHLLHKHADQIFIMVDTHAQKVRKKSKIYLCKLAECSFLCKTKDELTAHICGASGAGSLNADDQNVHENKSVGEKMFQCNFCTFATTAKPSIVEHVAGTHKGLLSEGGEAEEGYTEIGAEYGVGGQFVMSAGRGKKGSSSSMKNVEGKDKDMDSSVGLVASPPSLGVSPESKACASESEASESEATSATASDKDSPQKIVPSSTVEPIASGGLKLTLKINRSDLQNAATEESSEEEDVANTSRESNDVESSKKDSEAETSSSEESDSDSDESSESDEEEEEDEKEEDQEEESKDKVVNVNDSDIMENKEEKTAQVEKAPSKQNSSDSSSASSGSESSSGSDSSSDNDSESESEDTSATASNKGKE